MNKGFDTMNKHFYELNTILDERKEIMAKGFDTMNKHFDELHTKMNKQDEKWEGDRRKLKEDTEGESKQVSGNNVFIKRIFGQQTENYKINIT